MSSLPSLLCSDADGHGFAMTSLPSSLCSDGHGFVGCWKERLIEIASNASNVGSLVQWKIEQWRSPGMDLSEVAVRQY